MNKTPRLSKSGIEYLDYQWGIFSGCRNWKNGICLVENCWAKSFAQRFPGIYPNGFEPTFPNGFEPTFYPEAIDSPKNLKMTSTIGVGWVGDVIGYCRAVSERSLIYQTIMQCPQHQFLFLTKNPEMLIEWSPFPDNCWVGVTATEPVYFDKAVSYLGDVEAKVKFISFEPLLKHCWVKDTGRGNPLDGISWVIISAQTKPYKPPKIEWVGDSQGSGPGRYPGLFEG